MVNIIKKIKDWCTGYTYDYGTVTLLDSAHPARKHKLKKVVEFILWKPGQHSHTEDYWIAYDP